MYKIVLKLIATKKRVIDLLLSFSESDYTNIEIDVTEATLLTTTEAKHLPDSLKRRLETWWLKLDEYEEDSCFFVPYINKDGLIDFTTQVAYRGIRPALKFNPATSNIEIGEEFNFGYKTFKVISNDTALCITVIGSGYFDKKGIDYKTSKIKSYIDNWFDDVIKHM